MLQWTNGALTLTEVPMQSTFTEWQQSGVTETCQDCHMPGGRHTFRGVYDLDWLRSSVVVEETSGLLHIRSEGVGHHFPSGDLFRHLTVEARPDDAWVVLHTIGRQFEVQWEDGSPPQATGGRHKPAARRSSDRRAPRRRAVARAVPLRFAARRGAGASPPRAAHCGGG